MHLQHHSPLFPQIDIHHRSNGDCLEGKRENYQIYSVQYCVHAPNSCVQCKVVCWLDLAFLWLCYVLVYLCVRFSFLGLLCYRLCFCCVRLISSVLCKDSLARKIVYFVEWDVKL